MQSTAHTVAEYLQSLSEDRKHLISLLRDTFAAVMPDGIIETMRWGMITYEVPLEISGATYNGKPLMYAALASQKHHVSIYLTGAYMDQNLLDALQRGHEKAGKRLDMGKACIRIKRIEDIDLESVSRVLASYSMQSFIKAWRLTTTKA